MVSFDDGYKSCVETAMPILNAVGLPAVFVVPTSYIQDRLLDWGERTALILNSAKRARAHIRYPINIDVQAKDPAALRMLAHIIKDTPALDLARFLGELAEGFGVEWHRDVENDHANKMVMTWDDVRTLAKNGMDIESHSRRHRELERQLGRECFVLAFRVGYRIAHF